MKVYEKLFPIVKFLILELEKDFIPITFRPAETKWKKSHLETTKNHQ